MALAIRLTKTGKRGEAKYRVIVKEKRDRRDGKALELLGFFEKKEGGKTAFSLKKERIEYWVSVGATVSPAVKKILSL